MYDKSNLLTLKNSHELFVNRTTNFAQASSKKRFISLKYVWMNVEKRLIREVPLSVSKIS